MSLPGSFEPSTYQRAIFEFADHGSGDAFISAVAGSGKTTTLVQMAQRLPAAHRGDLVFCAFNRHIAEELGRRLPEGARARTIHSIGFETLRRALQPKAGAEWVNERKYRQLAQEFVRDQQCELPPDREYTDGDLVDSIASLTRLTMATLTATDEASLFELADRFDVDVHDPVLTFEGVRNLLEVGPQRAREEISYDDMVWLPVHQHLPVRRAPLLYVDECQDLSACQQEFLLRLRGGRAFWVGDPRQAIYAFAGADAAAVASIIGRTGAVPLPLSICYRCPSSHVALARAIVPEIEAAPWAETGVIGEIAREGISQAVRSGDLVLCRTNAPLVELAYELIAQGVPARVRGRDIGAGLVSLVDHIAGLRGYAWPDFPRLLERWREERVRMLGRREGNEMRIQSTNDKAQTLETILARALTNGALSEADLRSEIETIFSDREEGVVLSTVHKAKGLEAGSVYILRRDLMPHPMAKTPQAVEQEQNLRYVALTRARRALWFVR